MVARLYVYVLFEEIPSYIEHIESISYVLFDSVSTCGMPTFF